LGLRIILVLLVLCAGGWSCGVCSADADVNALRGEVEKVLNGACSASLRDRHEGMLLYLLERIEGTEAADEKSKQEISNWTAQLNEILESLRSGEDVLAGKRGRFEWAYKCGADGSGQPIMLTIPQNYDGRTPLPLVVALHGSGGGHGFGANMEGAPECIELSVNGRGDSDFEGLGELAMLDATKFVLANYNIDRERVVPFGYSMGAGGAMRAVTRYPDVFTGAVVVSGWATGLELGNLDRMTLDIFHGDTDYVVPTDLMRLAVEDMNANKGVSYRELAGAGHGIIGTVNAGRPLVALGDMAPAGLRRVKYSTDQISRGSRMWVTIEGLADPHAPGSVDIGAGRSGVCGETRNVCALRLRRLRELFPGMEQVDVILDGQKLSLRSSDEALLVCEDARWRLASADDEAGIAKWALYQRRGHFNIYDGQPIVIVPLKGWADREKDRALVKKISSSSYIGGPPMPFGGIPVMEPDGFDAKAMRGHLILIGSPAENPVVARIMPHLPVRVEGDGLVVDGVGRFRLRSTAMCMTYYNPFAPECRIVWFLNASPDTLPPDLPLPDGDGFSPDIVLYDISGARPVLIAAADYGGGWALPVGAGGRIYPVDWLARKLAEMYGRALDADYVLYRGTDWFGAKKLAVGSLKSLLPVGLQPICRARLTAEQLDELHKKVNGDAQLSMVRVSLARDKRVYDVVFDESVIWRLGCHLHYGFPRGSIAHTGRDVAEFVDRLK